MEEQKYTGLIQAFNQEQKKTKNPKDINEKHDIIVTRNEEKTYINENNEIVKKIEKKYINLTKKTNETAKLIKAETAQEKLAEIEKIFTK